MRINVGISHTTNGAKLVPRAYQDTERAAISLSQHSPHLTHALHCPTKFIPKFVPHVIRSSPGSPSALYLSMNLVHSPSLPPKQEEKKECSAATHINVTMLGGQLRSHSLTRVRSPCPMKNAETYVGTKHRGIPDTGWCVGDSAEKREFDREPTEIYQEHRLRQRHRFECPRERDERDVCCLTLASTEKIFP